MFKEVLTELYARDLNKLKTEIEQYKNEADLWIKPGDVPNSAGNLCLHLCGNLQHFFGAVLGGTDYVRNRDAEFSKKGVSRGDLVAEIDVTSEVVRMTLEKLSDEDFSHQYPIDVFGKPMTT